MRLTEQGEVVSFVCEPRPRHTSSSSRGQRHRALIKSETEAELVPTAEFDEAMEAPRSGTGGHRRLVDNPATGYFQAASPLEELALLTGSRPARRSGLQTRRSAGHPWVFAWSQNRASSPVGMGGKRLDLPPDPGERGESLLKRMYVQSRLFRLVIDEVEKTLAWWISRSPDCMPTWSRPGSRDFR
jgi:phosphoenolpyruvate carboxylase